MHRLLVAAASEVRVRAAEAWLLETARIGEVLILAPTRRAADDFVRLAAARAGALVGVHRATLGQLAAELAALPLAAAGRARLSKLGAEALAARSVHLACREGPLAYFEPVVGTPGFPRAAAETLLALRLEGVRPEEIPPLGAFGRDLARMLAAYHRELAALALADEAQVLATATEVATSRGHPFARMPLLLLDVAPASPAEAALLAALAKNPSPIFATALEADDEGIADLEALLRAPPEALEDPSSEDREGSTLDRARRYVFQAEAPAPQPADGSFGFFSAPSEARECLEIAREIRRLAEAGHPFDRLAILLRSPETYQPLVQDALRRAEIPSFTSRGARRPEPSGRALLALLACAAERLSASRFAEYLSLAQVPDLGQSGAPPTRRVPWVPPKDEVQLVFTALVAEHDPDLPPEPVATGDDAPALDGTLRVPLRWEQLLVDAAVIGGRERWARRLGGLEQELRRQLRSIDPGDEPRLRKRRDHLRDLKNLERFALPVIGALAALPKEAPWRDWLSALERLVTLALRAPEPVLTVLAELRPMAEVGPVSLGEVIQVLQPRLSFLREEPTRDRYGRVFVGTLEEAAGRTFDVVFVPGLAEGIFPRRASEDPLLLDEARRALRGEAFERRPRRRREERLLLRRALGAARHRFVASYPRMDAVQGRPRVPSFYALDLLRAAEGALPSLHELAQRAAGGGQGRLGWPAPERPEDALDDAEFDLALLEPLIAAPPDAVRGLGRYLLEDEAGAERNPHLVRSLRAQFRRGRPAWREDDGLITPPAAAHLLERHRLQKRAYSASALQGYAACPYRFALHAIHHLRPREEAVPLEALDPATRGSLFHDVQYELFMALRREGALPVTTGAIDHALVRLDQVFAAVAAQWEDDLAPAIPEVWRREMDGLRADLRQWLRRTAEEAAGWAPRHAELAFGLGGDQAGRDPASCPDPVAILGGYQVRGSVDLVEERTADGALRVTDHKTGKLPNPWPRQVGGGEVLQPVLYASAVEAMLGREVDEGRLYYCTSRGEFTPVPIPNDPSAKARLGDVLGTIDAAVERGFLPAAPKPGGCTWCDYTLVCGPEAERRVAHKDQAPLERLVRLRRTR